MDHHPSIDVRERACSFTCEGEHLVGVVHPAGKPRDLLVLIVVGGPQYRIGAHRQFVDLARRLAAAQFPAMRFDYRGLGDATGDLAGFEMAGADIRAAIDTGLAETGARRVVLWGLCDAASAICFYAGSDPRVAGIVLANPWVRTEAGAAQARLSNYYRRKLVSRHFLTRLLKGEVHLGSAIQGLARSLQAALGLHPAKDAAGGNDLRSRMAQGLAQFRRPVLVLLSDQDLTADEFRQVAAGRSWRRATGGRRRAYTTVTLSDSDHTFSQPGNHEAVATATRRWLETTILSHGDG